MPRRLVSDGGFAARALLLAGLLGGCEQQAALLPDAGAEAGPAAAETRAVRVQLATVQVGRLDAPGTASGVVAAFRQATVAAETAGRVLSRRVEPGTDVAAGDLLLVLDGERAELAVRRAEAELAAARVDQREARYELRRGEGLHADRFISEGALDDLRFRADRSDAQVNAAEARLAEARRTLEDTGIRAPFAGRVERVHAQEGDYLSPGTPVAELTDFSRARVMLGITAEEAARLEAGQAATVAFEALGGQALTGTVHSVSRLADGASGTYPVEIWLAGAEAGALRVGMLGSVRLPLGATAVRPLVPTAAVFRHHGSTHVYRVAAGAGVATVELLPVRIGRRQGDRVEVLEGLAEGDRVVVDGQFALRDGAAVRPSGEL